MKRHTSEAIWNTSCYPSHLVYNEWNYSFLGLFILYTSCDPSHLVYNEVNFFFLYISLESWNALFIGYFQVSRCKSSIPSILKLSNKASKEYFINSYYVHCQFRSSKKKLFYVFNFVLNVYFVNHFYSMRLKN